MNLAAASIPPAPERPTEADPRTTFETRLINAVNDAGMVLMLSLGHRAGLLAAMADGGWRSSGILARETGLVERYVREWLGAMSVSGVVEIDDTGLRYRLPEAHADLLTDEGSANLAVYAQFIPTLAVAEEGILGCFRHGGGLDYAHYPRFHEVMAEDSAQTVLAALDEHILPLIPGMVARLESGIRVLDAGCGRGLALMHLAARFPASRFTGYDLCAETVEFAGAEARARRLDNVVFEVRDLADFDTTAEPAAFDFITTFDAVHDQPWPLRFLQGVRRGLAPDGVYLAQDVRGLGSHAADRELPLAPLLYAVSTLHCTSISLAQGGEGLGTMWGRPKALEYLRRAGFGEVQLHELEHDIQNDYYVCRP